MTRDELLKALQPAGDVYVNDSRFPQMLRVHKTSFIATVKTMPDGDTVRAEIRNPENTGHWSRPRRTVVIFLP